ncbi:high-affinity methionine permease [Ophiostoma piceae UAMH 11346]|uniref:High-affinity methionine permease n=1 Tax=Ophiostoma piceae (strain UAMH 11346) TaxID=1262450 RepID=S3C997_OPHP1|nr:high-affinity methionine permease [Ophiostoma piceae UAMH 11346]
MAPSPVKTSFSSSQPFGFINGAISTAASPLQANFNLSCRSPIRPSRTSPEANRAHFLDLPKHFESVRTLDPLRAASIVDTVDTSHDDDEDGDDDSTVDDRCYLLPQPSPGIPSLPLHHPQRDDGKLGVVSAISIIVGKTMGVGAYSVPSAIFAGVGSVGMSLAVWLLGSLISFCGLAVYLDLGTAMPRSGGERVYLERIFRRPRMLATCMFMAYAVLLGFSTPNAIVLGEYALYALDIDGNHWNVRSIAVASVTLLCYIHARHPRLGLKLINILGVAKMLMLVIVVLCGIAGGISGVGSVRAPEQPVGSNAGTGSHGSVMGHHLDADMVGHMPPMVGAAVAAAGAAYENAVAAGMSTARRNFHDVWAGSSSQPYDYATALLKVIYCFRGYSTANQVLSDVKNPVRTLRVAAPLALVLVSVAYLAITIAFFLVVDKDEFRSAGVVVAGRFFRNLFGDGVGAHVLPIFVIVSAAGNIAATSFAQARVNEELAKDGMLPFARFWATRGLLLHWLVSSAVIIVPPPGKIYNFLVDIGGYPVSAISVAIAMGLLYLQNTPSERWVSPWPASRFAIIVFAGSNCLLLILPWVPPVGGRGENERFAYYAYPATALAVIGSGALYWLWWRFRGTGREVLSDKANGRLTSPGWRRWKGTTGARRSSTSSSSTSEDNNYPSAYVLLSDDDAPGPSQPLTDYANIRRRAPCGCPARH